MSGPKAAASAGTRPRTAASHARFPGRRLERDVDAGPGRGTPTQLVDEPRPREQVPAGFVERHRHHARVVEVDRLDAVAVVDVEVEIQDAQPLAPGARDGERRVVVDAEPAGAVAHRVVQAAARMEGVLDVAAQDRLHRPQRAARDRRGRLVHARERRIVAALADARLRRPERILRQPSHGGHVRRGVGQFEVGVGCRFRREAGLGADGPQQVDARPEPPRRQRMVGPEVVRSSNAGRRRAADRMARGAA